ncbi:MAG: hypothetical protein AAGI38_03630, partial [Bacteroidota bacterium]
QTEEIIKHPLQQVEPLGVFEPLKVTEDWAYGLRNTEKVHAQGSAARSNVTPPQLLNGFEAGSSTSIPNDNDIAISRDGMVVSVTNSILEVYDPNGVLLNRVSLNAFGRTPSRNSFKYDPRVMYDPNRDRFVVLYLNGSNSNVSQIVVAFSQTQDPTGLWRVYALDGNLRPGGQNVWCDYPAVGMSNDELFITGNLFLDNQQSSPGTGIWQIDLESGFNGPVLKVQPFFLGGAFSMVPVRGGRNTYGPEYYFVRRDRGNIAQGGVVLHTLTNTIDNGGIFTTPVSLRTNLTSAPPPEARQPGSSILLSSGDGRLQAAYKEGDRIYYAGGVAANGGRPGILFGTIRISPLNPTFSRADAQYISSDSLDIGYPSMVFGGCTSSDGVSSTILGFNISSPNHFSGAGVVFIDTLGEASPVLITSEGEGAIRFGQNGVSRWGDYTGMASRFPGEAWMSGYHILAGGQNATWITQVLSNCRTAGTTTSVEDPEVSISLQVFPNPTHDMVYLTFEVPENGFYESIIRDLTGREVKRLVGDQLVTGTVRAGFNATMLPNGQYFLVLEKDGRPVGGKSFLVQH